MLWFRRSNFYRAVPLQKVGAILGKDVLYPVEEVLSSKNHNILYFKIKKNYIILWFLIY